MQASFLHDLRCSKKVMVYSPPSCLLGIPLRAKLQSQSVSVAHVQRRSEGELVVALDQDDNHDEAARDEPSTADAGCSLRALLKRCFPDVLVLLGLPKHHHGSHRDVLQHLRDIQVLTESAADMELAHVVLAGDIVCNKDNASTSGDEPQEEAYEDLVSPLTEAIVTKAGRPFQRVDVLRLANIFDPDRLEATAPHLHEVVRAIHQRHPLHGRNGRQCCWLHTEDAVNALEFAVMQATNSGRAEKTAGFHPPHHLSHICGGRLDDTELNRMVRCPQPFSVPVQQQSACACGHNASPAWNTIAYPLSHWLQLAYQRFLQRVSIQVVALVATTSSRGQLLRDRCLASIRGQTCPPDHVIVVTDKLSSEEDTYVKDIAQSVLGDLDFHVISNSRSAGASGAWNTGILRIANLTRKSDPSAVYIAILDDDDSWENNHLEICRQSAASCGPCFVISGLYRHEVRTDAVGLRKEDTMKLSIPTHLDPSQFLTGNPHVQGSNMFIRLDALLAAGLFDEHMPSCTDRDLMIRLLDLPRIAFTTTGFHTVHHFAEDDRPRLSAKGSSKKIAGLLRFWNKWAPRMSTDEKARFKQRAEEVFGWKKERLIQQDKVNVSLLEAKNNTAAAAATTAVISAASTTELKSTDDDILCEGHISQVCKTKGEQEQDKEEEEEERLALLVGIVADADSFSGSIKDLLQDLANLSVRKRGAGEPVLSSLDVLILENGPRRNINSSQTALWQDVLAVQKETGLRCSIISLERQLEDVSKSHYFPSWIKVDPSCRSSIAQSRTLLQTYLETFAWHHKRVTRLQPVVWILDSDKRLGGLVNYGMSDRNDGAMLQRIAKAQREGISAVFGVDTECPPLPVAFSMRTQLVDVYHALHALHKLGAETANLPPLDHKEVESSTSGSAEYYHDVSASTSQHLESPMLEAVWIPGSTAGETLDRCFSAMEGILRGDAVLRPLLVSGEVLHGWRDLPITPSLLRGGNTFVLDTKCLRIPNTAPIHHHHRKHYRRSDMVWACLNEALNSAKLYIAPALTVRHVRSSSLPPTKNDIIIEAAVLDVCGSALYRTLAEALKSLEPSSSSSSSSSSSTLNGIDRDQFWKIFCQHLCSRTDSLRASLARIRGLLESIHALVLKDNQAWLSDNDIVKERWQQLLATFDRLTDAEAWNDAITYSLQPNEDMRQQLLDWLSDLPAQTLQSREKIAAWHQATEILWLQHRKQCALNYVSRHCSYNLSIIGAGHEGVVLRDTNNSNDAYKYMDLYRSRANTSHLNLLRNYAVRSCNLRILPWLTSVIEEGVHLVIKRNFIEGELYSGQRDLGPCFIQLMQECRAMKLVCNNIKPENLVVDSLCERLYLIDIGLDLVPWSEERDRAMAKRAFLTMRWPHRRDLNLLLTSSLNADSENALPELSGFEEFFKATLEKQHDAENNLFDIIRQEMLKEDSFHTWQRVLDYGCGPKGKLLKVLAKEASMKTTTFLGYDPCLRNDRKILAGRITLTNKREVPLQEPSFDLVLCMRVLCCISDDMRYKQVLQDLYSCCNTSNLHARVIVAICNPYFVENSRTPHQRRHVPKNFDSMVGGSWQKELFLHNYTARAASSCNETHNPLHSNGGEAQRREDFMRPMHKLQRDLLQVGFEIERQIQTDTVDMNRFEPNSDYLVLVLRPFPRQEKPTVSLVIKTCMMDWRTLYPRVIHLVRQLEGPHVFHERLLVVDSRSCDFLRQYDEPCDRPTFDSECARLEKEGWIDKTLYSVEDECYVRALNKRWFARDSPCTHAKNGVPFSATLQAFEACSGDLVVQVDSDIMVCRTPAGGASDYIAEAANIFTKDHESVTVSLNILHKLPQQFRYLDADRRPLRVEVRASIWHRNRLLERLPIPLDPSSSSSSDTSFWLPDVSWYRLMDDAICKFQWARSYRGGSNLTFFIHPPNTAKSDPKDYMLFLDLIEKGWLPHVQYGNVNLQANLADWLAAVPQRNEPYVYVICGHNVPPGRFLRCLRSIEKQRQLMAGQWGAVIVDDGSQTDIADFIAMMTRNNDRISLLQPRYRRGSLANQVLAIRHECCNPQSVIIMVDMDDCLIGDQVLQTLSETYDAGADVTVGRMLRTDKPHATPYDANLTNPRAVRGAGSIWQHLKTFRRALFLRIRDKDLRDDKGTYFIRASDWAMMLPLVEMAFMPRQLQQVVYLYEPSPDQTGLREMREISASEIMKRPSYSRKRPVIAVVGNASFPQQEHSSASTITTGHMAGVAFELGKKLADANFVVLTGGMGGVMEEACRGARSSSAALEGRICTVALLPGSSVDESNPFVDVALPTDMHHARNVLIAQADAIIIVGGRAGTLSELAIAWTLGQLVIAIDGLPGWGGLLAGQQLDDRPRRTGDPADAIYKAHNVDHVLQLLKVKLPRYMKLPKRKLQAKNL